MIWTLVAALLLQGSEDTYTMKVHVKADQKGNDQQWVKRAFADYDGIKKVVWDGDNMCILFTMQNDTVLSQAQLKEALPDRYQISKVELLGLIGTVKQNKSELTFKLPAAHATWNLEKWDPQPQWFEYVMKHAKEAEGFHINAIVESGPSAPVGGPGGPMRPIGRGAAKLLVTHSEMCKVKSSAAAAPDITLRFLVDDIDAKEGKGLEESIKTVKGVNWSEFDADGGMLALTFKSDTAFKVKDFEKIIAKKGKVTKVTVEGLTGTLEKEGANTCLKARSTGAKYVLAVDKPTAKWGMSITEKMVEKSGGEVRVAGELVETKDGATLHVSNIRPLRPDEE